MNMREKIKALLPVIQAFADGKMVEYKSGDRWFPNELPSFDVSVDWRIKSEPREFWIRVCTNPECQHSSLAASRVPIPTKSCCEELIRLVEIL